MSVRPGDALLYAASAARNLTWVRFKRMVDTTCAPDGKLITEMKYVRTEAVDVGSLLGHWEIVGTSMARRIVVAPPTLARLPWPGLPRSVLCGSRSPDTIAEVRHLCDSVAGLSLSISGQPHPYAPLRIEISTESEEQMVAMGRELSVGYSPTPAAWSIARASGSIERYLKTLVWKERANLNWDRREFDPELLRFRSFVDCTDLSRPRLITYSHPSGWDWRHWLWNDGASADVDRSWGRYCVLSSVGTAVLHYDHRAGLATVPRQVPLPKLLARALALSSGKAPSLVPNRGVGLRAYHSVPHRVFEIVATKLDQDRSESLPGEEGRRS